MRIATYNVNGITGRLPVLLRRLNETQPNVVCLQELRAPDEKFPAEAIGKAALRQLEPHGIVKTIEDCQQRRVLTPPPTKRSGG